MQHRVSLYQDRALPRSEMRSVEMHLRECQSCRATSEAYTTLESQLRTYLDVPRSLVPDLKSNVIGYMSQRRQRRARWSRTLRGGGAALSLLILIGGFVGAAAFVATGNPQAQIADSDAADAVQAIAQYTPTQDSAVVKAAGARFTVLAETASAQSDDNPTSATPLPPKTQPKTEPPLIPSGDQNQTGASNQTVVAVAGAASPKVPIAPKNPVPPTPIRSVAAPMPTLGAIAQSSPLAPLGAQFQPIVTATAAVASADTAPLSTAAALCIQPGTSPDGRLVAAFASSSTGYLPLISDSTSTTPRTILPPVQPSALNLR